MTTTPEPSDRPDTPPEPDDTGHARDPIAGAPDDATAADVGPSATVPDAELPSAEVPDTEPPSAELPATESSSAELPATESSSAEWPAGSTAGAYPGSASDASRSGFAPPWSGQQPPPPPPGTSGYATRFGLVRPVHNRYIAGVCGAFARATNTDPVLWRVALPVLTVLGGFGILVYLLGWLLIPAEGDTASPLEALLRRGWSSTSKWLTVVLAVIAAIWLAATFTSGFGWKIIVAVAVIGVLAVLGNSRAAGGNRSAFGGPGPGVGQDPNRPGWYAGPGAAPPSGAMMAGPTMPGATTAPASPQTFTGTGWPESSAFAAGRAAAAGTGSSPSPGVTDGVDTAGWQQPPAYRQPFAPGGPYAQSDPYAPAPNPYDDPAYPFPLDFPGLSGGWAEPPAAPPQPPSPRERRRVSIAGRVTVAVTALVLGLMGILDGTDAVSVPAPAYFAAALATVGLGLIIGSMFGRVRAPIALGIVLTLGLLATSVTSEYHAQRVTIRPTSVADLPTTYSGRVQQVTIDLRNVDFRNDVTSMNIRLTAGMILVELPPNVDAHVVARVGAGDTMIFGKHNSGGVHAKANVTDNGDDGPGGGQLTINANIAFAGFVEVKR